MNGPSLLKKILLSTSLIITLLLALTGWFVQDQMLRAMSKTVEREMEISAKAYESLWHSRAVTLSSVSLVLSNMSDVRAAFHTQDEATIRDTAGEMWSKISQTAGVFLVTDPEGNVIASLGGGPGLGRTLLAVRDAARNFPAQTGGFLMQNGLLYQMVITPVYVEAGQGPGLLNVLAAGYPVDGAVARQLKQETGNSDFVFVAAGRVIASTLPQPLSTELAHAAPPADRFLRVHAGREDFGVIRTALRSVSGTVVGDLLIIRSFAAVHESQAALNAKLVFTWLAAVLLCLAVSFWLAKRILEPVRELDRAAVEIAKQNYSVRVSSAGAAAGTDELGRLAATFNTMCESIQRARTELITRERLSTIGQLSTSIVHDLRNPLAAIYGGSELLMDSNWNPAQTQRLAGNIYRSSRIIKDMLQELAEVSRGSAQQAEPCRLLEVITAAADANGPLAHSHMIQVEIAVPEHLEVPLERARMERVFLNLIGNAIEAMPHGGTLRVDAELRDREVWISVEDSGPGVPQQIRGILFQPFATAGKKNGLGLGLALSRESVEAHGGALWLDTGFEGGTRFWIRLPV